MKKRARNTIATIDLKLALLCWPAMRRTRDLPGQSSTVAGRMGLAGRALDAPGEGTTTPAGPGALSTRRITRSVDSDLRQRTAYEIRDVRISQDGSVVVAQYVTWLGRLELMHGIPAER
jgi:hypothetical protein